MFDPTFLHQHGNGIELERIKRQLLLKGRHHDNLIDILDGGQCDSCQLYYIVMPFLDAPSLEKVIDRCPRNRIRQIISQVAAAAEFLETLNIYHRDIKPANIAILGNDFEKAILLDLGVLRPLGLTELTDTPDKKPFIGTTQYSPPEFLIREEEETMEGYRSLTFYQLGAVLHDLLMRRPIFYDRKVTYGKLVRAVLLEDPIIDCADAPIDLVRLARLCLLKDPTKRSRLVSWESFRDREPVQQTINAMKERVHRLRSTKVQTKTDVASARTLARISGQVAKTLCASLKQSCIDDADIFPPAVCQTLATNSAEQIFEISFAPSARHGLDHHLHCFYKIKVVQLKPQIIEIAFAAGMYPVGIDPIVSSIPFLPISHEVHDSDGNEVCLPKLYAAFTEAIEEEVTGTKVKDGTDVTWLATGST